MPTLPTFARSCLLASWLAMAGAQAELIIGPEPPTPAESAKSKAHQQREKAEAIYRGHPSNIIILDADDEEGILSPRGGAPAQERAFEQRWRARVLQEGHKPVPPELPLGPVSPELQNARNKAAELRGRARSRYYTGTGNWQDLDLSQRDKDGLPLVHCHSTDNVSGRIGDDSVSGSVVILNRNGQQLKVRCR